MMDDGSGAIRRTRPPSVCWHNGARLMANEASRSRTSELRVRMQGRHRHVHALVHIFIFILCNANAMQNAH